MERRSCGESKGKRAAFFRSDWLLCAGRLVGTITSIRIKHGAMIMTVLKRDIHQHTYADYRRWSRTYGDELVDGTAYVREPPSPSALHQVIVFELARQAGNALKGRPCRVFVAPFDVRLPKSSEADDAVDTVVQPDVLIVSDLTKIDEHGMRGAPDWVAEVLSPSTASYDRTIKLRAYERAAVPEVWLVHPIERTLHIYRLEGRHFGRPTILELKGQISLGAVAGVTVDWDEALDNWA